MKSDVVTRIMRNQDRSVECNVERNACHVKCVQCLERNACHVKCVQCV